jgi:tripartite-type tricarboxylate transporter receptor subunit TctC
MDADRKLGQDDRVGDEIMRRILSIRAGLPLAALVTLHGVPDAVHAQDVAKFYEGKEIRLIIGADVGGPYDAYGRLLGRHLARHIPGNPRLVMQNMPGATSVIAANYIYHRAPQDGTVIATLTNVVPLTKVLGEVDIQFDPGRLNWIGSMARELYTVYVRSSSSIHSLDDAKRAKVVMGGTGPTAMSAIFPRLINNVAGTQFHVVTGYQGMAQVQIALERGEIDGIAGDTWSNGKGTGVSLNWYERGMVRTIVLVGSQRPPVFSNVPLLVDLAKDPDTRRLLELFSSPPEVGKPTVMGPDVPAERVAAIRRAYQAMMSDPDFLADAAKLSLAIDPVSGEELTALVQRLVATPAAIAQRAREALRR